MAQFDVNTFGRGFAGGLQTGQQVQQMGRQNALADLYREQGPGIMQGDPGALNALAQFDPMQALGVRNTLNEDRRAEQMQGLNVTLTKERIDAIRADSARAMQAEAAKLTEAERAAERQQLSGIVSGARQAIVAGPEAWEQFKAAIPPDMWQGTGIDPASLTYETAPAALAMVVGMLEGVSEATSFAKGMSGQPADEPASVQALRIRASEAGLEPGTPEYQRFMATGGKSDPGRVIYGPDGNPILAEGDAAANFKFTEGQSKDNVYSTRARGALEMLEPVADALASRTERAAEMVPFGLARGMQTDDFQVAQQAGTEFLQAILRKDTGAAITQDETESYGRVYLPQPGDNAAVLEAKRQARIRAINALESGMSAQQMMARDRALIRAAEESGMAMPAAQPEAAPVTGAAPEYLSQQDRELWEFMTPEERRAVVGSYQQ